ncbi:hypothetical protein VP01_2574g3 [Puccinia sorghi]|uniref:Uncharacterized protein n=1 Tax=Puccinia sorghi TaxID=27349 RepID=A0A0L6V6R6_9BASI|nr:hypothetical protein VP01_2574g3 [Puccinia sorghi]
MARRGVGVAAGKRPAARKNKGRGGIPEGLQDHNILTRIFSTRRFKYLIQPILCAPYFKVWSPSTLNQLVSQTTSLLPLALLTLLYLMEIEFPQQHLDPITCLFASCTLSIVISGAEDGLVKNWELNQAFPVHSLPHSNSVSLQLFESTGDIPTFSLNQVQAWSFGETMVIYYEYLIILQMLSQCADRHFHWVGRLIFWQRRSFHAEAGGVIQGFWKVEQVIGLDACHKTAAVLHQRERQQVFLIQSDGRMGQCTSWQGHQPPPPAPGRWPLRICINPPPTYQPGWPLGRLCLFPLQTSSPTGHPSAASGADLKACQHSSEPHHFLQDLLPTLDFFGSTKN